MKRFLSILLAVVLIFTAIPLSSSAISDNFVTTYSITDGFVNLFYIVT